MPDTTKTSKWVYIRWFLIRFVLVIFDILAINAAHFLALVIRFYVAEEFHRVAPHYIQAFSQYTLLYTGFCLVVFCVFKLYSGIWKYAGFNDLNRILFASGICFAAHVGGTLLFGMRMPITFYCIGAAIQFFLITASRFSYRLLLAEKKKVFGSRDAEIHALVVGTGTTAKSAIRELDREDNTRVMCVLDYKNTGWGSLFDGIPVVKGTESLKAAVEKYHVNYVILASVSMPEAVRNEIKDLCKDLNVEAQDYSGFLQSTGSHVAFRSLMECTEGPVDLVIQNQHLSFSDGKQAMRSLIGRYMVKSVWADSDVLVVELDDHTVVQNDLNVDWVKDQEKETGEAISFF